MDIFSIIQQPNPSNTSVVSSAYRQNRFVVMADSLVPPTQPMYADVYFYNATPGGGSVITYYKTMSSYSIENSGGTNSLFIFDIQDAPQEYLKNFLPLNPLLVDVLKTDEFSPFCDTACVVYFRGSTISIDGILTPNPIVPIQGTATTPPVSGSGTPSYVFYIFNSTIYPEFENIYANDLERFWATKWVHGVPSGIDNDVRIYPLSNLPLNDYQTPNLSLCNKNYRGQYALFPITILSFSASGGLPTYTRNCSIYLSYGTNGSMTNHIQMIASQPLLNNSYYLPSGLENIKALISPTLYNNFLIYPPYNNYYRISIFDEDIGHWCFHSPLFSIGAEHINQQTTLFFQNTNGHFETMTFMRTEKEITTKSGSKFVPYDQTTVLNVANWLTTGKERYNTRSEEVLSLTATFTEELMTWVEDIVSSGYAWQIVYDSTNNNYYWRSVMVVDGSFKTKKIVTEAGLKYETTIKITPSINPIIQR